MCWKHVDEEACTFTIHDCLSLLVSSRWYGWEGKGGKERYYTSRPLYKRLDRVLQHYLRTSEFLYSMMRLKKGVLERRNESHLFGLLVEARRYMSLFQHHDGVTGTSKQHVMVDYGQKMFMAIKNCEQIILAATDFLLRNVSAKDVPPKPSIFMEEIRSAYDSSPEKRVVTSASTLIVFNSLGKKVAKTICVHVKSLNVVVHAASGPSDIVPQQISPVVQFIDGQWNISATLFELKPFQLCFHAVIPPVSFRKYLIRSGSPKLKATIRVNFSGVQNSNFVIEPLREFAFGNGLITAAFDPVTGHLKVCEQLWLLI
ncbi:unnamed protein product [Gongylonema pulchrum]|uniref:mannosyl-oligosaccharide 1,3-1,6-alpha-mannosidase n=1 Tax=Gongylonema pulchrum TaxID=637853 RepID=A0A183DYY2_9BILA|nr:unnamed protein product [Gongylonema pulchrum]